MDIFSFVVSALLLVLGLGITQLLEDAVSTFRTRHKMKMDWIPWVWAGVVFVWQMQVVWAVFELSRLIEVWSAARFVLLLSMALLLYVAGALVVPKTEDDQGADAWEQFRQDGRWALVALALFFLLAFFANPVLFGISLWEADNLLELGLAIWLVALQWLPSRRAWAWATPLFALATLVAVVLLSPALYE
ncbi:hypothetical protein [Hydrogenimonas sp.]